MRMKGLSCGAPAFVANVALVGCSPSSTDLILEPVLNVTTQDQLVFLHPESRSGGGHGRAASGHSPRSPATRSRGGAKSVGGEDDLGSVST